MKPTPALHVYQSGDAGCSKCGLPRDHACHDADTLARVVTGRAWSETDRVRRQRRRSTAALDALLMGPQ